MEQCGSAITYKSSPHCSKEASGGDSDEGKLLPLLTMLDTGEDTIFDKDLFVLFETSNWASDSSFVFYVLFISNCV